MTTDGGRRIATANGAILADIGALGDCAEAGEAIFHPKFWLERGGVAPVMGGRGAAWFLAAGPHGWVLRHYRRGGFMARISRSGYCWAGEARVRAFAEYRLLETLVRRGLPVPAPIAARYRRRAFTYRCDIIVERIAGAQPLSSMLAHGALGDASWRAIGAALARLHSAGVDHADLNAHNILIGPDGAVSVIDFDRGRLRGPGAWRTRNLRRLRRSLAKISRALPPDRFPEAAWKCLLESYESKPGPH
jgi:3-deoxy-D-manno-octulosonic acid kinase